MSRALVVLPLTLAVLLVSMCVPVACIASPAVRAGDPTDCGHAGRAASSGMHVNVAMHRSVPLSPVHQHGDPLQCKHSVGYAQAVTVDQQVRVADVVAVPAVATPVVPAAAPLTIVVNERPSRPPGLVLTVSQLRI